MAYVNGQWVDDATADDGEYTPDNRPIEPRFTDGSSPSTGTQTNTPASSSPGLDAFDPSLPSTQTQLTAFRHAADTARYYEDNTDTNLAADPRFRSYVQTGQYTPSSQAYPDNERGGDSLGHSAPASAAPATSVPIQANTSPQFTDPSQQLIESTALNRLQQLNNPEPNSGQAMYEAFAKQLVDQLKGPAYSPSDQAALKAQAFDSLEQDRTATHQRLMEELSRRGIPPSSGIALSAFQDVDRHYDQLRAQVTNQLAVKAIDLTRSNQTQALDVLGGLAGTQNQRLNQALDVSRIPYNLGTDAFNQLNTAVNAGGNPSQNVTTAIQLATAVANAQNLSAQQRAQYLQQLFSVIGDFAA